MKKLKKVLVCAAACVTACSVTALAACTDNGTPNTGLSADVTVAETMSSEALGAEIEKLGNLDASSFMLEGGLYLTKSGETVLDKAVSLVEILVKANPEDGNADIELCADADFAQTIIGAIGGGGSGNGSGNNGGVVTTAEGDSTGGTQEGGETTEPGTVELGVYLRDWKAFYPNLEGVGEGAFNYIDIMADVSEGAGIQVSDIVTMLAGGFMQDSAMLLTLANTTDSIVVDETEHTITLDINKMVYGLYGYIKQIINNLTETTTVDGLLKCSAVKYYINAFLGDMTAEELFGTFMGVVMGGGNGGEGGGTATFADVAEGTPSLEDLVALVPNEGEETYDYLVRMLNSQEFANIVGAQTPIGATKIVDMVGEEAAEALNTLKGVTAMLDQLNIITETAITVPDMGGMQPAYAGASVSGLQVVYTFDAQNVLQSVSFGGDIAVSGDVMKLALNLSFSSEAPELRDISAFTVNVYDEVSGTTSVKTVDEILNPPSQA